jgi:hypothetical protein
MCGATADATSAIASSPAPINTSLVSDGIPSAWSKTSAANLCAASPADDADLDETPVTMQPAR